jgi:hypothetical protein
MPIILEAASNSVPGVIHIINVSSSADNNAPTVGIDLQDVDQAHGGLVLRYGASKLANILHTEVLVTRYSTPEARVASSSATDESN